MRSLLHLVVVVTALAGCKQIAGYDGVSAGDGGISKRDSATWPGNCGAFVVDTQPLPASPVPDFAEAGAPALLRHPDGLFVAYAEKRSSWAAAGASDARAGWRIVVASLTHWGSEQWSLPLALDRPAAEKIQPPSLVMMEDGRLAVGWSQVDPGALAGVCPFVGMLAVVALGPGAPYAASCAFTPNDGENYSFEDARVIYREPLTPEIEPWLGLSFAWDWNNACEGDHRKVGFVRAQAPLDASCSFDLVTRRYADWQSTAPLNNFQPRAVGSPSFYVADQTRGAALLRIYRGETEPPEAGQTLYVHAATLSSAPAEVTLGAAVGDMASTSARFDALDAADRLWLAWESSAGGVSLAAARPPALPCVLTPRVEQRGLVRGARAPALVAVGRSELLQLAVLYLDNAADAVMLQRLRGPWWASAVFGNAVALHPIPYSSDETPPQSLAATADQLVALSGEEGFVFAYARRRVSQPVRRVYLGRVRCAPGPTPPDAGVADAGVEPDLCAPDFGVPVDSAMPQEAGVPNDSGPLPDAPADGGPTGDDAIPAPDVGVGEAG